MSVSIFQPNQAGFIYQSLLFGSPPAVRKNSTQFNVAQRNKETDFYVSPPRNDAYDVVIKQYSRQKVRALSSVNEEAQHGMLQLKIIGTGMKAIKTILSDMKQLAGKAMDSTTADGDRVTLNSKLADLPSELDSLINRVTYNKKKLLDGTYQARFKLEHSSQYHIKFTIDDMRSTALGLNNPDISSKSGAEIAYATIDSALAKLDAMYGKVAAANNRLDFVLKNRTNVFESLISDGTSIRSRGAAQHMLEYLQTNLVTQNQTTLRPEELHQTTNDTVLQLLVTALDLPQR